MELKMTRAQAIGRLVSRIKGGLERISDLDRRQEYLDQTQSELDRMVKELPSGGGFNDGTRIDMDKSSITKLVFLTSYHHMDEAGHYTRWTHHNVKVFPTFFGIDLTVSGQDYDGIKDYIGEEFFNNLCEEVTISIVPERYRV